MEFEAIWGSLEEQHLPQEYIVLLRRLYSKQRGYVATDRRSSYFNYRRGAKQGDPLSSTIFNTVLESVMRKLKVDWTRRRYGVRIGASLLQNLRFADDVLLIGTTRAQVKHMLEDLCSAGAAVGLKDLENTQRQDASSHQRV